MLARSQGPVRIGLIGAGYIGQLRVRALAKVPELRLAAVADPRTELVSRIAGSARDIRTFSDGMDLARDPSVDAVILSTPPSSHEKLGMACISGGKHLLCEKPLASTPAACEILVKAAAAAGLCLATGFNLRYTRAASLARRLLESGGIGELDHIRSFHGHPGGKEFTHDWVYDRSVTGGGALMDNGIHLIDLTRWFLGDVQTVIGFATNHTWKKPGCEDNGFLLLKNSRGKVATLQASWTEWRGYRYRIELYGTQGFMRFGYPPMYLLHGRRDGGSKTRVKHYFFPVYQVQERIYGYEWGLIETLALDLKGWAHAIATGSIPPISGFDGMEAVRIAQAAEFQ